MSRSDKNELHKLDYDELEQVIRVQQRILPIMMGQAGFEHPGSPFYQPGERYQATASEKAFVKKTRNVALGTFAKYSFIGFIVPYATLRLPAVQSATRGFFKRPFLWGVVTSWVGGMYGMSLARILIARDQMRQEQSPLSKECRYQMYLINPNHPFLLGFDHELDEFESHDSDYQEEYSSRPRRPERGNYFKNDKSPRARQMRRRWEEEDDSDDGYDSDYEYAEYKRDAGRSAPPARRRARPTPSPGKHSSAYSYNTPDDGNDLELKDELRKKKRQNFYEARGVDTVQAEKFESSKKSSDKRPALNDAKQTWG